MHVEKPECDRGERRWEPVQRQNTTRGTGIITRPTETTLFVPLNKMEACDLWTASICLEQGETQIHVCYYGLSILAGRGAEQKRKKGGGLLVGLVIVGLLLLKAKPSGKEHSVSSLSYCVSVSLVCSWSVLLHYMKNRCRPVWATMGKRALEKSEVVGTAESNTNTQSLIYWLIMCS